MDAGSPTSAILHILGTYTLQFVKEALGQNKPSILMYNPIAPHAPMEPFVGDQTLLTNLAPYRPPSFNEVDVSDKPEWPAGQAADERQGYRGHRQFAA